MTPSVFLCFMGLVATGRALMCYDCDNSQSQSCGQDFQAYQFEAMDCDEYREPHKCGKQIQEPNQEGWVGVIRGCYQLGSLPGVNESDGCHTWVNPQWNFSATYCFCDLDYCNSASTPTAPATTTTATALLLFPRLLLCAMALLVTFCLSSCSSSSSSSSLITTTTTSPIRLTSDSSPSSSSRCLMPPTTTTTTTAASSAASSSSSRVTGIREGTEDAGYVVRTEQTRAKEKKRGCYEQQLSNRGGEEPRPPLPPSNEDGEHSDWTVVVEEEPHKRHKVHGHEEATSSPPPPSAPLRRK